MKFYLGKLKRFLQIAFTIQKEFVIIIYGYASVAQLDRAMASDAMCRWFESSQAYHKIKPCVRSLILHMVLFI